MKAIIVIAICLGVGCVLAAADDEDSGPSIFGERARVMIQNYKYEYFLSDGCQSCRDFDKITKVIGLRGRLDSRAHWYQQIVGEKRGVDDYYSFAFDRKNRGQFRVIYASFDEDEPISKIYNEDNAEGATFRFVPVPDYQNQFLIISQTTGMALEMGGNPDGGVDLPITLKQPNFSEEGQMWTIHHI